MLKYKQYFIMHLCVTYVYLWTVDEAWDVLDVDLLSASVCDSDIADWLVSMQPSNKVGHAVTGSCAVVTGEEELHTAVVVACGKSGLTFDVGVVW